MSFSGVSLRKQLLLPVLPHGAKHLQDRHGLDPAAFTPLCPADSGPPFWAGTKLPSINAFRISSPPRLCNSVANSSTMRRKISAFTHCWNLLWHVWYGGYRSGKSFHGAPRGFRPLGSFLTVDCSKIGFILLHCLSVSSIKHICKKIFH
jgi:hypothetical protein